MNSEKVINIKSLRKFVDDKFPGNSLIKYLVLSEPDQMPAEEFLVKMKLWLRLLRMESNKACCEGRP
ncbi:MAG: hypothetical protein QXF61_10190 [Nitrososphaeria archaeon]